MINNSLNTNSFLYAASLSPLDRETEYDLAVKMENGDKTARKTLILANLRYAIKVASSYQKFNMDYSDLVAVAVSGLVNGVDHYKANRNTKVITYATWWIRAEFKKLHDSKEKEVSVETCTEAMEQYMMTLADEESMSPEEYAINSCFKDYFYKTIKSLPSDERKIFLMHHGLAGYSKHNLAEIGEYYGKTKQWAWLKAKSADKYMADKMQKWAA